MRYLATVQRLSKKYSVNTEKRIRVSAANSLQLSDGFTAHELASEEEMKKEGRLLQNSLIEPHEYVKKVKNGTKLVSIHTKEGKPIAILEVNPQGKVIQLQGRRGMALPDKFKKYVGEALEKLKYGVTAKSIEHTKRDQEVKDNIDWGATKRNFAALKKEVSALENIIKAKDADALIGQLEDIQSTLADLDPFN